MYRNWRELIRPREVKIDTRSKTEKYAKFTCEPLQRGYGVTLGNALRRILIGSIMGSAVTKVQIKGAVHEFTSLPDVKEDVTDIILNLKNLRVKLHGDESKVISIDIKGPASVTGADIVCGADVEVLNPSLEIATVGEGGHLKMSLTVENGRGYVSADENKKETDAIDMIAIDSVFNPIQRINYSITNARVGQRTDFQKLVLEVWTDGSVKPEDSVAFAAKILKEQLTIFINFDESLEPEIEDTEKEPVFNENLLKSVEELELSVRSYNCLQNAGIKYVGDLVQKSEIEMLRTKNFGRKSLREIKNLLKEHDLELGMDLEAWPPASLS